MRNVLENCLGVGEWVHRLYLLWGLLAGIAERTRYRASGRMWVARTRRRQEPSISVVSPKRSRKMCMDTEKSKRTTHLALLFPGERKNVSWPRVALSVAIAALFLTILVPKAAKAQITCASHMPSDPLTDKDALVKLYCATDGATWTNNTNWLSAMALSQWHGVTTDGTPGRVTDLYLTDNNLSGEIPAELGELTNLQNLYLWQNNLSGEIPAALGDLTNLQILFLEDNKLSGEIPAELGDLTSLQSLYLAQNGLSGEIPAELGDLTSLLTLDLQNNNLSGEIPAALGDLTSLQNLFLRDNNLSGEIPAELGDLTSLQNLFLRNNNLSGEIPAELGDLTSLLTLDLQNNNLSGEIPAELGDLTSLQNLYLAQNNLSGEIPAELGDLTSLLYLYLWGNKLSGEIPAELGDLTSLLVLDLARNNLSGEIPAELGDLTSLWSLFLWGNNLSGEIPAELGDLTNLFDLDLARNNLSGEIPAELGDLTYLETLYLNQNELSGEIPAELGGLTSLFDLDLAQNELSGEIPAELGDLTSLENLSLSANQLSGSIPTQLGSLASLQQLFLNQNELTGSIPTQLGSLTSLQRLYLNNNQLTGSIPTQLGSLTSLQQLYLDNNMLTGSAIPTGLATSATLQELGLWANEGFTATISNELGKRVDRAVLRKLYNVNNGSEWTIKEGWFPSDETAMQRFTFSSWYGVETDATTGRVSALNLPGNNLKEEITNGLAALEGLTELDLSDNAELTGELPSGLRDLSITTLNIRCTGVATPVDAAFRTWIAGITFYEGCETSTPPPPPRPPVYNGPQYVRVNFDKSTLNNLILTLTWEPPELDKDEVTGYEYKIYEGHPTARVFPALIDWTMTGNVQEQDIHVQSDAIEYTVFLRAVMGDEKTQHHQVGAYVPDRIISVVLHTESETPVEFSLGQNYPNPFNPETAIRYALPKAGEVRLTVYDMLGHEVVVLVDGLQSAGFHTVRFDGSDLSSGPYVYRLQGGDKIFIRTMILVK